MFHSTGHNSKNLSLIPVVSRRAPAATRVRNRPRPPVRRAVRRAPLRRRHGRPHRHPHDNETKGNKTLRHKKNHRRSLPQKPSMPCRGRRSDIWRQPS